MISILHDPQTAELHEKQGRAVNFPIRVNNRGDPASGATCDEVDDLIGFVVANYRSPLSEDEIDAYVRCFCLPLDVLDAKGRGHPDGACFESVYLLGGRW